MNKSGLKTDLINKLKEAVENNVPIMEDRPAQVTDNAAGDQFAPGVYWKLLETIGELIDEYIMNVEDGNFCATTMLEEEHNISFSGKPTKTNYEHFDRSPFIKSVLQPEISTNEKMKMTSLGKYSYK